jgi:L-aspartate oxidase
MEFYQFHPTSLYTGPGSTVVKKKANENAFLITEAVRGHGGRLFNHAGERFMARYDDRLELAPRDVVARAIDCEIRAAAEAGEEARCVYLDVSHLPADDVLEHFPGIAAELSGRGLDMTTDRIPVVPAAHYLCGGVRTDLDGQTSLDGLFACGETACTGLHGANRLASNSLLEAVVFATRAFRASADRLANDFETLEPILERAEEDAAVEEIRAVVTKGTAKSEDYDGHAEWARLMRDEVQRVMWSAAGIVRDSDTLARAEEELTAMLHRCNAEMKARGECLYSHELRNLITVGLTVLKCAGRRKESRGLHYNVDFPERVESERIPTVLKCDKVDEEGETGVPGGPNAGEDVKFSFTSR